MVKRKKDILSNLFNESDSYSSLESIDRLLQEGMDLTNHPIQPLYLSLKSITPAKTALALSKLSKDQRKVFLDLDLWEKDDLDLDNFSYWVRSYAACPEENLRIEFAKSSEFAVFLKGRVNIWTFDVDDPQYPDHENYFLTDDNLLLIEYDDKFDDIELIKSFINEIYSNMGVEAAYAYLFKIVSDSFLQMQETEYQHKKGRMNDVGIVDYFDALEINNCFANIAVLNNFIDKRSALTAEIDAHQKNQVLHKSALMSYREGFETILQELNKVSDSKRLDYLHFNFIRLVNGTLSLENAIKDGTVAMTRVGNISKSLIQLGASYASKMIGGDYNLFELFDFIDLYRIGNTLIRDGQKELKKGMRLCAFGEADESFLGGHLLEFVDNGLDRPTKYCPNRSRKAWIVVDCDDYYQWKEKIDMFVALAPFVKQLYQTFKVMQTNASLMDEFYLNYSVAEIDFEAILISSFANVVNGKEQDGKKLGLTLDEFKTFVTSVIGSDGKLVDCSDIFASFEKILGFDIVPNFSTYLATILSEQLEGYDYQTLAVKDYKHVGGPIILNS